MQYYKINYLLFLKFIFFNSLVFYLLGYIYHKGWLSIILNSDISFITPIILLAMLFGFLISGYWSFTISKELIDIKNKINIFKKPTNANENWNESLKLILSSRILVIRHIAWAMVLLGLLGTVLGFIMVLSSIDPMAIGNINMIGELMSQITQGLGVALYTTLAGSFGNLWLMVNFNMIQTATIQLYSQTIVSEK